MTNRQHERFTTDDGLHGIAAWRVARVDEIETVPADVGRVARVVRPGSLEYVNGIVSLIPAFPPVNRAQYAPGDEIELYPFLADGAQPFTVLEVLDDDDDGASLKLRVQSTQPGAFWELLPGENTLANPPAGFSGQAFALEDGVRLSAQRWLVLHDHADGSPVWRELVTRDPDAPAPGGGDGGGGGEVTPRRVSQFAAEYVEGTTRAQVGILYFVGETLSTGSLAFLASTGDAGAAVLELVHEQSGETVATWSTTSDTITPVSLGQDVSLDGMYGLQLSGEGATTIALFRGIDLSVRTT